MKQTKRILHKLLFPPAWIVLLFSLISVAGMILVTVLDCTDHPLAYCVFAIATYALTIFLFLPFPVEKKFIRKQKRVFMHIPLGTAI